MQQGGSIITAVRDSVNDQWVFNLQSDALVILPISATTEYEILGSNNIIHEELTAVDDRLQWDAELDNSDNPGDMQVRFSNWGLVLFNVPTD